MSPGARRVRWSCRDVLGSTPSMRSGADSSGSTVPSARSTSGGGCPAFDHVRSNPCGVRSSRTTTAVALECSASPRFARSSSRSSTAGGSSWHQANVRSIDRSCPICAAARMSCPVTSPIMSTHASSSSTTASYQSPPTWSVRVADAYVAASSAPRTGGSSVSIAAWRVAATRWRSSSSRTRSTACATYEAIVVSVFTASSSNSRTVSHASATTPRRRSSARTGTNERASTVSGAMSDAASGNRSPYCTWSRKNKGSRVRAAVDAARSASTRMRRNDAGTPGSRWSSVVNSRRVPPPSSSASPA